MRQLLYGFIIVCLLTGCGRVLTPTPETPSTAASSPAVPVATPSPTAQPTSTPRPATPLASPTPTTTPTPVIYTVQAGDTLLDIAIRFDRSTEAIQTANGIVDPRLLQIGQELIIPPPEGNPAEPPTPTPTPPPLLVEALNFQRTPPDALWCLGQVSNPGSEPLTEVVVEAALFDGSGVQLARAAAFTQLDVIQPGQAAPFAILFNAPPSSFAQYQVAAVSGVPASAQARYYFDLDTFDTQGTQIDLSTYRLSGQLRNQGSSDAEAIRLVAVAYDAEGKVLAQRQADLAVKILKAGAVTPFQIDLFLRQGLVSRYQILAQGLKVQ